MRQLLESAPGQGLTVSFDQELSSRSIFSRLARRVGSQVRGQDQDSPVNDHAPNFSRGPFNCP